MAPFLALLFSFQLSQAAIVTTAIEPGLTDPAIAKMRGPHLSIYEDRVPALGTLLVSIAGTNSVPSDFKAFDQAAAGLGYEVLALDYDNHVISTYCRSSKEKDCFERFREENFSGRDLLPDPVTVSPANSIDRRLRALIAFVAKKNPERWARYLRSDGEPDWGRIVAVGHSQGSGHAVYLGMKYPLRGVIALAGPQDSFENGEPAHWVSEPGATLPERHAFLLHQNDFFGSEAQLRVAKALLKDPQARAFEVDTDPASCAPAIFMSKAPVPDAHMSVIDPRFESVWKCLLTHFVSEPGQAAATKAKARKPAARKGTDLHSGIPSKNKPISGAPKK